MKRVAVLVYDGCLAMEAFTISDLLLLANRVAQAEAGDSAPPFRVEIVSLGRRRVVAAGGTVLGAGRPTGVFDLLVVPGLDFGGLEVVPDRFAALAAELDFIRRTFSRGTPVASVCVGAFLLAEAGLLDGRKATTAWLFAPQLAHRYPRVRVQADALTLEDAGVTMAGAFNAANDLAMHIIRSLGGTSLARKTADMALVSEASRSQSPFVDWRVLPEARYCFADQVRNWLSARYSEPYDLPHLARAFHISPRTLLRRFKAETGMTPLGFLQEYRVLMAKELLRTTPLSIAQVTERVGYADVATFGALFRRRVRLSPAEYRRRFAGQFADAGKAPA